jgi:hypothetical protein
MWRVWEIWPSCRSLAREFLRLNLLSLCVTCSIRLITPESERGFVAAIMHDLTWEYSYSLKFKFYIRSNTRECFTDLTDSWDKRGHLTDCGESVSKLIPKENFSNHFGFLSNFGYSAINFTLLLKRMNFSVVRFLLGNSPSSEFYMSTFRNTLLFHLHRQVGV